MEKVDVNVNMHNTGHIMLHCEVFEHMKRKQTMHVFTRQEYAVSLGSY